jgi:serine/threonine protein kinase
VSEVPRLPGYQIKGELSRTSVSIVYLAEDVLLGRRVAVKALREPLAALEWFRQRFLCECRVAASFDHPHVVPIYNFGDADGSPFVVMPYLRGGDLQLLLERSGPLGLEHAASIVAQAASALDHIHARGLVHRDVKPKNLLLDTTAGQRVYLCDFGITAGCHCPEAEAIVSPGSVGFRSPEQTSGQYVDRRSDVYSLGCVLYSCLTAAPPGHAGAVLPAAPQEVIRVLAKAMAPAATDRYASCGDLAAELREVCGIALAA